MTTSAPAVGAWTTADNLPTPERTFGGQHDGAVRLDDGSDGGFDGGKVLVAGGASASGSVDAAAVFHPQTGAWTPVDALGTGRRLHSITTLPDGKVLVAGGLSGSLGSLGPGLSTAELFDPATGSWTPTTGAMNVGRWGHSATLLPDGSVLVAGGSALRSGQSTLALRSAERFDPDNGRWTAVAAMTDARTGHTAVPLADGLVLVCAGVTPVGTHDDPALAFCELYDPDRDRWTPTGSMLRGRRHHQATALSDTTVLVTGGTAPGSPGTEPFDPFSQRTTELFDLATGTWEEKAEMPSGRAFHRAIAIGGGRVLVIGGAASDRDETGYRSAIVYDSGENKWTAGPGLAAGRWAFAATALQDGKVLVTAGISRSGLAAADPAVLELTAVTEVFEGFEAFGGSLS